MIIMGSSILVATCVLLCMKMFMKIDREHGIDLSKRVLVMICLGSWIAARICFLVAGEESLGVQIGWLILQVCFLSSSLTDHMTCQVYDVFQYVGVFVAASLLAVSACNISIGISIVIFALLQYLVFMKLYGKADGMSFQVAALALASRGYEMDMYFLHMIAAYLLLSVVQGIRGNIGVRGKLKEPVPFLPYITIGFWLILLLGKK